MPTPDKKPSEANVIGVIPCFDYKKAIEAASAKDKKQYSTKRTFGLKCLRKMFLDEMIFCIEQINNAPALFLLTEKEVAGYRAERDSLEQWRDQIENASRFDRPNPMQPTTEFSALKQKSARYTWLTGMKTALDKEGTWQGFIANDERLERLHVTWQKMSLVATWNNEQLCFIAENTLPRLKEMQQQARKEVIRKRRKLPAEIFSAYKQYLDNLGEQIGFLEMKVGSAMYMRLKLIDDNRPIQSTIHHFTDKLKAIDFDPIKNNTPDVIKAINAEDPLTPKQFAGFHAFIAGRKNGCKTRQKLHQLSWFKNASLVAVGEKKGRVKPLLVPAEFEKLVPTKRVRFKKLFKGENFRREFFQDKLMFLGSVSKTIEKNTMGFSKMMYLSDFSKAHRMIARKEAALLDEASSADGLATSFNRLFHSKTRRFVGLWQAKVGTLYQEALTEKLVLAETMAKHLASLRSNDMASFPWEKVRLLNQIINELGNVFDERSDVSEASKQRLEAVRSSAADMLFDNEAIAVIDKTQTLQGVTADDVEFLSQYGETMCMDDKGDSHYQAFLTIAQARLRETGAVMRHALKAARDNNNYQFDRHFSHESFIASLQIIKNHGRSSDKVKLEQSVLKYFLFFMQAILLEKFDKTKIESMECFFEAVGGDVRLNGKSLSEYIQELKENRQEFGFELSYPIKCIPLAEQLAERLFDARFERDFALLESRTQSFIEQPEYASVKPTFIKVKELLVQRELTVVDVKGELRPSECVLLGLDDETPGIMESLLNMNATARGVKSAVDSRIVTLEKKVKLAGALGQSIGRAIATHSPDSNIRDVALTPSKRKALFSKAILPEELGRKLSMELR